MTEKVSQLTILRHIKWLNIALIGGYEIEKYRISSLEKRMTASQIESAQKLVREWEEKHQ